MDKKLVKKISESTEDQIEKMLEEVCKMVGADTRILLFRSTGGLHYLTEKIAHDIYLNEKDIDEEPRRILQLVNLGFSINKKFGDLYYDNGRLKEAKDKWEKERILSDVKKSREEFTKQAKKYFKN